MIRILSHDGQRLEKQLEKNLCCFLFCPTETPSVSLHDEVLEVVEIPGLLTKSKRKYPDSEVITPEVVKETTAPTMSSTDDVGQPVSTGPAFEPIQAPTSEANREATFQTVLPTLEANEPTVPSVEKPPPELNLKSPSPLTHPSNPLL